MMLSTHLYARARKALPPLIMCLTVALAWLPAPAALALEPDYGPTLLAQRKGRKAKRDRRTTGRSGRKGRNGDEAKRAEPKQATGGSEPAGESKETTSEGAGDEGTEGAPQGAAEEGSVGAERPSAGALRRSNKMEFDARLIRGQTAGSGAVVLFDRGQRDLPALTKTRTRFLDATVREVYDDEGTAGASGR